MARLTIDEKIERLETLTPGVNSEEAHAELKSALKAKHNRLVAKAAKICGEHYLSDFIAELQSAFRYFADKQDKDKACFAKKAIIKALYEMDYRDDEFYATAISVRQHEPVWGGHVDTAVDVRCWSALGLTLSANSRVVFPLLEMLHDEEPQARLGAVKAIACLNISVAEVLLREKILDGDEDSYVVGECFQQLMRIEPDESLSFLARYLAAENEEIMEYAALAISQWNDINALECLQDAFDNAVSAYEKRKLLEAIALHRSDTAKQYLLDLLQDAPRLVALAIVKALSIYKNNESLKQKVNHIVCNHAVSELQSEYTEYWLS